jgi:hypothetical protein
VSESPMNSALRQFEAAEANIEKLERIWGEMQPLIPSDISFGRDSKYEDGRRAYTDVLVALPKIDGWKPESLPPDLYALAQNRLDAREIEEISAIVSVEESATAPGLEIAEYRYRLNKKRRTLVRAALQELMASVDECLKVLRARYESDFALPKDIDPAEWEELKEEIQQIEMLLGGSLPKPPRWSDLHRHLHFGMTGDLRDIVKHDWPQAKAGLSKGLYDENEPIPVEVEDIGTLAASHPTGPVTTKLKWNILTAENFERLIFSLISSAKGYENPEWLMHTNAPDRGRDLSVTRVVDDPLAGVMRSRVLIQCKHWTTKSVSVADVSELKDQITHWEPPKVDVLVIATSGRFTSDAVAYIEKHNGSDRALRIEMWPESHLERLLASRPSVIADFGLR